MTVFGSKAHFSLFLVLVFSLVFFVSPLFGQEFPQPSGFVNDFAGILSPETKEDLERDLTAFEVRTSNEIAVVTVSSLEGTTVEDYAVRLFEDWEIGKEERDNGVLFLIAPKERQVRIEVGYGLEPFLTDAKAGRIIREEVAPSFKKEDFNQGVIKGTAAIKEVVVGEGDWSEEEDNLSGGSAWVIILTGFFLFIYIAGFLARTKDFFAGGITGAIFGAIVGAILSSFAVIIFAALGLGLLGLILDFILSRNYKERKRKRLPTSWGGSWGGFSSGGSSGGFGGFSGGSSGGGGASGSW